MAVLTIYTKLDANQSSKQINKHEEVYCMC